MTLRWLGCWVLCSVLAAAPRWGSAADDNLPGEREQSAAARKILEAWQPDNADAKERFLHVLCWTPSDREFPRDHHQRLSRMLRHIQAFYAGEMARHGFGERSIRLQRDGEQVVIHDVRGTHPYAHYGKKSGTEIRQECAAVLSREGIDVDRETIAIFCNLATWDEAERKFSHNSPYYAGGSVFSGTAWQLDSPELDTQNLKLTEPKIQDGEYGRISLGRHNSIFIGGMAHELGHALSLPHCEARPDEAIRGAALMGAGNRSYAEELRGEGPGTFLTFAHALRLASHPQFSGMMPRERLVMSSTVDDLRIRAEGKAITVAGRVSGEPPIYGVVAYFDPEGNDDYNATTATAVPARDGTFSLRSEALARGKKGMLRLYPLHVNGVPGTEAAQSRLRFSYEVGKDGMPDVSAIETRLALAPIVEALAKRDAAQARRLKGNLKSKQAAAIAAELLSDKGPTESPAQVKKDVKEAGLTSFRATSAKVGWNQPAFNRIPEGSLLLEAGGELFATGIYAHAPARHEYDLGGEWRMFRGKAGVASGHSGSVEFEVLGDGKSLWKSAVVREGELVPFEVKVEGVKQLELTVSPTEDGPGSDWGLWLEPQLKR